MKLRKCLAKLPFRNLLIIARQHRIYRGQNPSKAELVDRLTVALQRPDVINSAVQQLSPGQRQALDAIVAAGGELPWPDFRERFGDLRPYRPWREDMPAQPWRDPISPAEALWYRGLIYQLPRRPRSGQQVRVVIPDELLERLPRPEEPDVADAAVSDTTMVVEGQASPAAGDVVTDVALLISLLHREDVEPLWGRWLAPRHFRDLNERFSLSEDLSNVRSELQTGRLRFVHYLAETAGLVELAGRWLKPTPVAWAWLEEAPTEQHRALWSAWREEGEANSELWQRFRLPGHEVDTVLDVLNVVLDHLARLERGSWYAVDVISERLAETEPVLSALPPAWRGDEVYDVGVETVGALIEGPLAWWGVVRVVQQDDGSVFRLSVPGEWLLAGAGKEPGARVAPWRVYDDLAMVVPDTSRLSDLVQVEAMAEWRGWLADGRGYQVTPASLSRALARSVSLEQVADTLARGQGERLTQDQMEVLKAWAAEVGAVSLWRGTVLETREAGRLQALSAHRAVRACFRRTLSPRAVVVDEGRVDNLLRALGRHGVWPLVDLPRGEVAGSPTEDAGAAAYLWVAGQIYRRLGQWIDPPLRLPAAVLDDLTSEMSPESLTVARQAVEDVLDGLAEAMDGWARFPMPGAGLAPEEALPIIEQAITKGRTLEMTYWTAGRGERTVRTVDPYRIEWRGDVAYLVGYCHERMDERVFRVDRIEGLQVGTLEG